jgi:hypothetical protein
MGCLHAYALRYCYRLKIEYKALAIAIKLHALEDQLLP